MLRYAAFALIVLFCSSARAGPAPSSAAQQASAPAASGSGVPMDERLPGDHWTVEALDEITGTIDAVHSVVTEVTATDISVRAETIRADKIHQTNFRIFDRSWNTIRSGQWQYFPFDGNVGIQAPLTVGKSWAYEFKAVSSAATRNWSGSSKVIGQETVSTKAGTFEAFKIETTASGRDFKDPSITEELAAQTWYAPALGHWVKRSWITRSNNHLSSNYSYELVELSRKQ
jgi:hypothetical protein